MTPFMRGLMRQPPAVMAWVGMLVLVNGVLALFFLHTLEAKVVLATLALGGVLMELLTWRQGFTRLLGLGHILWLRGRAGRVLARRRDRAQRTVARARYPRRRSLRRRRSRGKLSPIVGSRAPVAFPAVSRHLKVLERAGLMRREIVGRVHHCHATLGPLRAVEEWIQQRNAFWDTKLAALGDYLDGETDPGRT